MRLKDYDTTRRFDAFVEDSQRMTPRETMEEVKEITFALDGMQEVHAGQSIGVLAPGRDEFGTSTHLRLYTVADRPEITKGRTKIKICVRRCSYIDDYSGEEFSGIASHFLCDLQPGDVATLTGPYGDVFQAPAENDATLIMIGAGTGIAPFRAFCKHLYEDEPRFEGRVILLHGGRTGMEMLYQNEILDDFALYYDLPTFEAIQALSKRPHWSDEIDWHSAISPRGDELWDLLTGPNTYVYIAGIEDIRAQLDEVFVSICGSLERWRECKSLLEKEKRWIELLY